MSTARDVRARALELPRSERARLARELLLSLDEPLDDRAEVEAAWQDEAERRLREVDEGSAKLVDWETVRREVLATRKQR